MENHYKERAAQTALLFLYVYRYPKIPTMSGTDAPQ